MDPEERRVEMETDEDSRAWREETMMFREAWD